MKLGICILKTLPFFFVLNCLKANKSPFDISSKSPVSSGFAVLSLLGIGSASKSQTFQVTPPSNVSYGVQGTFRLIPGVAISYKPSVTGTVDSWSISPALPTGLTFNSQTGEISGTPDTSYLVSGFPLTTFTITAQNSGGLQNFPISLQVLASGENVWTIIDGVAGANTFGSANSMKYDPVSNSLYAVGMTSGNLDGITIPSTGGTYSGFISKYDLNGNKIWTKVFGVAAASHTWVQGLIFDSSGNIYINGSAETGTISGLTVTASSAGYIAKFDQNGNLLWLNSSLPSIRHEGTGVTIDGSGNLYLSTIVRASALHLTNNSWSDAGLSIVKYNGSTGAYMTSVMLSSAAGTYRGIEAQAMVADSSGNLFIVAATRTSTYCGTNTANYNPALFRFNSSLTYLGCTALPVSGNNTFSVSLSLDTAQSNVYISGYANGASFESQTVSGSWDAFLTKLTAASGTKLWTKLIGASGSVTTGTSTGFDSNGYVYLAGMTSASLGTQTIAGSQDMFIAKYDSAGTLQWVKLQGIQGGSSHGGCQIPANPGGCSSAVSFDSNNTLYTSGATNGTISGVSNPASPNSSLFLVRNVK